MSRNVPSSLVAALAAFVTLLVAWPSAHAQDAPAPAKEEPSKLAPLTIENPGFPAAYYYKPRSGRSMKPVIVYLHGRDGNPEEGCRQWAKVATEFGWLLCPSGQEARAGGGRGWANDWPNSTRNVMGALLGLRKKFGRKAQLYGNVLIGFSEGAYIAQNIGPRETKTFNRWLIVASCDRYFGFDKSVLHEARKKIKRVYLWTGETDGVVQESQAAYEHLRAEGVSVKLNIAQGYGHQIPVDTMSQNYRKALRWLVAAK
jgi:predicted esterase